MSDKNNELQKDSLGLFESIIMGIAGSAPAYSIEVTTATLIMAVGIFSPASIFYSGLIMFGIVLAFLNLNKVYPSSGASYTWVSKIFSPFWGYMCGWSLLFAMCIFMVTATVPISNAFLLLFYKDGVNNTNLIAIVGAVFFTLTSFFLSKGIKMSSYFQIFLTILEIAILLFLGILGLKIFSANIVNDFSFSTFLPWNFSLENFISGALIAIYFYVGWDVVMNLSEETKDSPKTSAKATIWSLIVLIMIYVLFVIVTLFGLSFSEIENFNTNILYGISEKLYGANFAKFAVFAVFLSTVGTVETGMLQFTRTLFVKARDGFFHKKLSELNKKSKAPTNAILMIWVFSIILIFASSYIDSVNKILSVAINTFAFQVSFYFGIASLSCAFYFRNFVSKGISFFLFKFLWPLVSGSFLVFVMIYSFYNFDFLEKVISLGGILIGIIPYIYYKNKE